jgi:hypothetical protein
MSHLFLGNRGMLRVIKSLVIVGSVIAISACAPRGESKSLSEVLDGAKTRYAEASGKTQVEGLSALEGSLANLIENPSAAGAKSISETLRKLIMKTGYTSRPALGELIEQYQIIGFDTSEMPVNRARVKLLVARTYNLLARELETTAFGL